MAEFVAFIGIAGAAGAWFRFALGLLPDDPPI